MNSQRQGNGALRAVISGSYRKRLKEIYALKEFLLKKGIDVQSPVGKSARFSDGDFVVLDQDPILDHRLLQDSIFAKIRSSSLFVVCNPDRYLGPATLMEMGYAISLGVQILTLIPVTDPNLKPYCREFREVFPDFGSLVQLPLKRACISKAQERLGRNA